MTRLADTAACYKRSVHAASRLSTAARFSRHSLPNLPRAKLLESAPPTTVQLACLNLLCTQTVGTQPDHHKERSRSSEVQCRSFIPNTCSLISCASCPAGQRCASTRCPLHHSSRHSSKAHLEHSELASAEGIPGLQHRQLVIQGLGPGSMILQQDQGHLPQKPSETGRVITCPCRHAACCQSRAQICQEPDHEPLACCQEAPWSCSFFFLFTQPRRHDAQSAVPQKFGKALMGLTSARPMQADLPSPTGHAV